MATPQRPDGRPAASADCPCRGDSCSRPQRLRLAEEGVSFAREAGRLPGLDPSSEAGPRRPGCQGPQRSRADRGCDLRRAGHRHGLPAQPRLVATVEHVADGATSIELKRSGEFIGSATVIGADAPRDLALVRTNTPIHGYAFHINGRAPRLGEEVVALGFPLGLPLSATRGVVSGSDRTVPIEGMKRRGLVQTTPRSTTATAAAP